MNYAKLHDPVTVFLSYSALTLLFFFDRKGNRSVKNYDSENPKSFFSSFRIFFGIDIILVEVT